MSGSVVLVHLAGAIALVEPACNTVAYFFHEKLWQKLDRQSAGQASVWKHAH